MRLTVEALEDRCVPAGSLLQPISLAGFTVPPSAAAGGVSQAGTSADGRFLVYTSDAPNLVVGQSSSNNSALFFNVFRYNRLADRTTLVSGAGGSATVTANDVSTIAALSADGNVVAFVSAATNLTAGQGNTKDNVFLYDATKAAQGQQPLTLVSSVSGEPGVAAGGATAYRSLRESDISTLGSPFEPDTNLTDKFVSLSPDGRFVSYQSYAGDLVPNQSGPPLSGPEEFLPGGAVPEGYQNTFLFDSLSLRNTLVSGVNGSGRVTGDRGTVASLVTSGGSVVFLSMADNLIGNLPKADGGLDVYLSGPAGQPPTLVTRGASQAAAQTFVVSTSADGRYVVFTSNATNVVPGQVDSNADQDVFLLDRQTNTTVLVSHTPGSPTTTGDAGSPGSLPAATVPGVPAVISADGNFVAFVSSADNLVPNQARFPADIYTNIYLYNRQTGQVTLLTGYGGDPTATGLASTFRPVISADGRYVAFTSTLESFFT